MKHMMQKRKYLSDYMDLKTNSFTVSIHLRESVLSNNKIRLNYSCSGNLEQQGLPLSLFFPIHFVAGREGA